MRIDTSFAIGERVRVDGGDIVGVVTAFEMRPGVHRYEVSWFHNGDEFRLSGVE